MVVRVRTSNSTEQAPRMKTRALDGWGSVPPMLGVAALLLIAAPFLTVNAADGPIVGRVFDTSLGVDAGIDFALVELHIPGASGGATSATTDADGSFAITLPPGDQTHVFVSVSAQGYYPFKQWSSGVELRQASPLAIGLQPAPQRIDTTIAGIVYDAGVGRTAPIADAEVHYTYHSYQEAFPEVSDTLRTAIDGRYSFEQPLGAGDWIEFTVVAAGFADFQIILGASELIDGPSRDFGLAPVGGMIRIDPAELHIDCPATFPVTFTNVSTVQETLVILGIDLHFHYGEGVYGTAFVADLSQVHFPVLLASGEQLRFPMTFIGGGAFPSLLSLSIISGARNVGAVAYFGGFHRCAGGCPGDCDGSSTVTVDEILMLVNMALGDDGSCPNGVAAGITPDVSLIVRAVNNALNACGAYLP